MATIDQNIVQTFCVLYCLFIKQSNDHMDIETTTFPAINLDDIFDSTLKYEQILLDYDQDV